MMRLNGSICYHSECDGEVGGGDIKLSSCTVIVQQERQVHIQEEQVGPRLQHQPVFTNLQTYVSRRFLRIINNTELESISLCTDHLVVPKT